MTTNRWQALIAASLFAACEALAQTTVSVAGGYIHSLALRSDGTVLAWGWNDQGQLGQGGTSTTQRSSLALPVPGLQNVAQVAAGWDASFAVLSDGTAWSWGENNRGQLGDGTYDDRPSPTRMRLPGGVRSISASRALFLAAMRDGSAWSWGLYSPTTTDPATPIRIDGISGVVAVAAGDLHALLLREDGTVWSFGGNADGQLGYQTSGGGSLTTVPRQVPGLAGIVAIAAVAASSYALAADGSVWTWGSNEYGQLGDGVTRVSVGPVNHAPRRALIENVAAISAGGGMLMAHVVAMKRDGTVWTWGFNLLGQLGDGSDADRSAPAQVAGVARATAVGAAGASSFAMIEGGAVLVWGTSPGGLGDGGFATRRRPSVMLDASGEMLDLTRFDGVQAPAEFVAPLKLIAQGSGTPLSDRLDVTAQLQFRPQDIGSIANIYVFALAPAALVRPSAPDDGAPKSSHAACVLAQLNSSGQMVAVSSSNLQAYLSGVLGAQGAAVTILNGVPASSVAGTTFYVGYGSSGSSMISTGTNRSVVSVDGVIRCNPQPPQTGWWWNPAEDGRGYSIEVQGSRLFFASFLYDTSGRSTWHVATGAVSVDGSIFEGALLAARGGQTLGGPYPGFPTLSSAGSLFLSFHNANAGTMVWPGGTVPIQRFNIVPNGLSSAAVPGQPQDGWWWNEQESGRGFFMEFQGGTLDIAGYMYDDAGEPVWYLIVGPLAGSAAARTFSGSWWSYANGQALTGAWRPATRINSDVAPVTITFSGADSALMTLPNGRTTLLRRHRF